MKSLGIGLIVLGIAMMIITGFNYTTEKDVLDLGRVEITKEVDHPVQWSPIIGGILLIGGIVALVISKKKI